MKEEDERVLVHFMGWEDKWNTFKEKQSPQLAAFRVHTQGTRPSGFMMAREVNPDGFGKVGDVLGCFWDLVTGEVRFSLNGRILPNR